MNCLTRLLALGVLALGTAGHSAAALAALPSAHSSLSEGRDRDSFEVAQVSSEERKVGECVKTLAGTKLYDSDPDEAETEEEKNAIDHSDLPKGSKVQIVEDPDDVGVHIAVRVWDEELNNRSDLKGFIRLRSLQRSSSPCENGSSLVTRCASVSHNTNLFINANERHPNGIYTPTSFGLSMNAEVKVIDPARIGADRRMYYLISSVDGVPASQQLYVDSRVLSFLPNNLCN